MVPLACSKCGITIDSEDSFCSECGEKISSKGKNTKYILKRIDFSSVKSTFSKTDDQLLYRVEEQKVLMTVLIIILSILATPLVLIGWFVYNTLPFRGLYFILFDVFIIPFAVIIFTFILVYGRTLIFKIFSVNNDEKGIIKLESTFFNLGQNWKFTTTDSKMIVSLNFSNNYEGILKDNQIPYIIKVKQDKTDKGYFNGISKIEAFNKQKTKLISIEVPENKNRSIRPPLYIEINVSESINELLTIFLSVVVIYKYFLFRVNI